MRNATRLLMLLVPLALFGAGCGGSESAETATTATGETTAAPSTTAAPTGTTAATETPVPATAVSCDEPVTVGVITDLTGALSIYGAHINRGVPIGFAFATGAETQTGLEQRYEIDDCELRVLFRDDQSNPELSVTAARELIDAENAKIIIGSVKPGIAAELQKIARDNDVILIAAPDSSTDLTGSTFDPNTFRTSRSDYQDHMAICDQFVNGNGYKTFVQIAPDHAFGIGGAAAYRDACEFYGGEFVQETVFAPANTQDFASYVAPLAESGADAFLVTWTGGGFPALVESAMAEGVIDEDTVLGAPFVDNLVMKDFFASLIGSTSVISYHYTAPSNAINDYLVEEALEKFGTFPDIFDVDGMNAAIMIVEALKATEGAADSDSLRAVLEGISFDGPKGLVEIRAEDHVAIQDIYVVKLLNLDDKDSKFYEKVATLRPGPPCLLEGEYSTRCLNLPMGSLSGLDG